MSITKPNDTELPDIRWLLVELKEIHKSLRLIYQHGRSDLLQTEFYIIDKALETVVDKIEHVSNGRTVIVTHDIHDRIDLSINSITPIFLHFWSERRDESFENYFYRNLNPDVAPVGFLEQVDALLQLSVKRPINIFSLNNPQELAFFKVIKHYIESQ